MDAALDNQVPGIKAQCGGAITCSTCHCYVDEAWIGRITAPSDDETIMLEYVWQPRKNSRLSCQVVIEEALDGIVIHLPQKQA